MSPLRANPLLRPLGLLYGLGCAVLLAKVYRHPGLGAVAGTLLWLAYAFWAQRQLGRERQ